MAAALKYPGSSPKDSRSVGFQWTENYISDMLEYKAVNGADNHARPFAVVGVVLMGLFTGLAFVRFAPAPRPTAAPIRRFPPVLGGVS